MFSVRFDPPPFAALQADDAKQVRFATMVTINRAAYAGAQAVSAEIESRFDSPTPWVVRGVRYTKARKDRLHASIDLDYWGNKQQVAVEQVLKAEVYGGQRALKRHEIALNRIGVLPDGFAIVPGEAASIDQYGNMQAGQIVQILAYFRAFGEQGYKANMTDKGRDRLARDNQKSGGIGFKYFVVKPGAKGGLVPGVYQRFRLANGSAVKPVMIFVKIPRYSIRLDFNSVADRAARTEFESQFPLVLAEARRTAR